MVESLIKITFPCKIHAEMTKESLEVDEELQPLRLSKTFTVEDNVLIVHFRASDVKMLRVGMSSFFDMALVASKTLLEFEDCIDEA
mmetsp:Transcript_22175/g.30545  ORF Transcript_22175/g.30545 Transcript_22175/m.30545 type:complete len:86 (-) Transcript_22175:153-410(-)